MKVWRLKNLQTNEFINEAQPLPENWGPIFGLSGFIDRLDNLSWLGESYSNFGWFEVGEIEDVSEVEEDQLVESTVLTKEEEVLAMVQQLLNSSVDKVAADNTNMTAGERAAWIEYRRLLREVHLQPDFPDNIYWPARPE